MKQVNQMGVAVTAPDQIASTVEPRSTAEQSPFGPTTNKKSLEELSR